MPEERKPGAEGRGEALYLVAAALIWLGVLYALLASPQPARQPAPARVASAACR